ncbi:helix-turn-helix domain-containing protein [Lysinibacillus louembei]|uniref:Helix-turn-helix domain-containing protein n=1 Tax=Lysinibacillus louembei TaxID=1470088 RepID=A0ABZ0RZ21_9BACI|nr:helix-turn-helix domain-containing protein [Lysinibacillus louembei]WPK12536.1 helix-turn-helix domain-containing protein [Lysinibacillus louembei]
MDYKTHMLLWENAYVKIKKMEYVSNSVKASKRIMPHSAFLIIVKGEMELCIGQIPYHITRFSIFHIGKSEQLQYKAASTVSYYMIYYQGDVMYVDALLQHLYIKCRPFHTTFSCIPNNPVAIESLVQNMYSKWQEDSSPNHLFAKGSFYELVAQIFQELATGKAIVHEVDLAESAKIYIEKNINQQITVQKLADFLNISTRHLLRIFKERYGEGPQNYLQQYRLMLAQKYLQGTSLSIKEISLAIGYEDEYYFSRMFKKQLHITPSEYRLKYPVNMSDKSINNENHFQYNDNQLMQAKLFENGSNTFMLKKLATPFLFSLILLLAACGADATEKSEDTAKEEATTRVITDDAGREVEIPIKPERVVTDWYLGQMLALDVVPVGAVVANLDYAAFLKQYYKEGEITNIGTDGSASLEKILELKPDLIITWNAEDVEKFEKIAPTIVFSESAHQSAVDEVKAMGEYLGRQAEAEKFAQDFEKRIAAAREKIYAAIPEDATFTIFDVFEKNATVVANNSVSGGRALYQVLGMKPQEKVQELFDTKESNNGRYDISYEVVGDYVGDYVFVINFFNPEENFPATWTNLDVVKNNETLNLAPEYYFASDPLSALHQAEEMAETIVQAAKSAQ